MVFSYACMDPRPAGEGWGTPPPEALQRLTVRGAPSLRLCPESSHCRGLPGRSDSALRPTVVPALLRLSFPEVRPGAPQGELVPFRTHFSHFLYLGHDCPSFPDV